MKTLSDGKLYQIIQRLLAMPVKAHNHDDLYSNGARRTYNSGELAVGTTAHHIDSIEEKFYIVQIATTTDACATVCFDWQMLHTAAQVQEFGYTIVLSSSEDTVSHSWLGINKTSTGVAIACAGGDKGHYIKRVVGYR